MAAVIHILCMMKPNQEEKDIEDGTKVATATMTATATATAPATATAVEDKDSRSIWSLMFDFESDDVPVDPDELYHSERRYVEIGVLISTLLLLTSSMGILWPETFEFFKFPKSTAFWITLLPSPLAVYALFFVFAYPNVRHNVKANITRKGTHLTVQIVVFIGFFVLDNEGEDLEDVCSQFFWIAFYTYWSNFVFMDFVRKKSSFFRFAFRAIDRKEDRPYTLLWNATQTTLMIGLNATITGMSNIKLQHPTLLTT